MGPPGPWGGGGGGGGGGGNGPMNMQGMNQNVSLLLDWLFMLLNHYVVP